LNTNGYILTNDHVVSGFSSLGVQLSDGKQYTASLVGAAPQEDLAVLRIQASGLRPIHVANSDKVEVGQFAIALGSPLGLEQSATIGIVSALDRSAGEGSGGTASQLIGLIQTSAPINPGNSGGALVDLQGNLIGVPTLAAANPENGIAANGIGFAIPSNRAIFVAAQLIKYGKLVSTDQGYLGIQGVDVTPDIASAYSLPVQSGVLVAGFSNDAAGKSPAQQAGIQTGDIIIDVNGQSVVSSSALASALLPLAPGTKVKITVVRGSSRPTITVTLGERPAS
jgi:S1-C subfamily serine protease